MAATLQHFHTALSDTRRPEAWRWQVRRVMAEVRDLLVAERPTSYDGWLAARAAGMLRERDLLLARLAELGPLVLHDQRVDELKLRLERLLADVERHQQRRRDLIWDEVELELGGSE